MTRLVAWILAICGFAVGLSDGSASHAGGALTFTSRHDALAPEIRAFVADVERRLRRNDPGFSDNDDASALWLEVGVKDLGGDDRPEVVISFHSSVFCDAEHCDTAIYSRSGEAWYFVGYIVTREALNADGRWVSALVVEDRRFNGWKVLHDGHEFYFCWWPAGRGYSLDANEDPARFPVLPGGPGYFWGCAD